MLPLQLFDQRSGEHAELMGWSCSWYNPYSPVKSKRSVFFLTKEKADKCAAVKRELKMINVNVTPVTQPKWGTHGDTITS